jgi:hypothetical protein
MIEKKDPSHQSYTQQTESCVSPIHLNYAHVRVNQHREAIEKNSDECSSQTPTDVPSTKNVEEPFTFHTYPYLAKIGRHSIAIPDW